jgi:hypothetical protein
MINSSTNINKTKNHFSPQLAEHTIVVNLGPDLGQAQKGGRFKQVNGVPTIPSIYYTPHNSTKNKQYQRIHLYLQAAMYIHLYNMLKKLQVKFH